MYYYAAIMLAHEFDRDTRKVIDPGNDQLDTLTKYVQQTVYIGLLVLRTSWHSGCQLAPYRIEAFNDG